MDIFFIVTTIAVVVITALVALVFARVWKILKNIERITGAVASESELLKADISELRAAAHREGLKLRVFLGHMRRILQAFFRRHLE